MPTSSSAIAFWGERWANGNASLNRGCSAKPRAGMPPLAIAPANLSCPGGTSALPSTPTSTE